MKKKSVQKELFERENKIRRVYLAVVSTGKCKVCKRVKDLRMGSCFHCSDHVMGKPDGNGGHILWDSRNPSNRWYSM